MTHSPPLKILISAYACRPGEGSEPGVGWQTALEVAKYHRVWVLTRRGNQPYIEAYLGQHPQENLRFIYCEPPIITMIRGIPPLVHLHYYWWQVAAYFQGKKSHRELNFDLVHHVTYVRYSTPSFLVFLNLPFVWGSVGGGEQAPRAFWSDFSWKNRCYEWLRWGSHRLGEWDPFVGITARRSAWIRATTPDTAHRLSQLGAAQVAIAAESGMSPQDLTTLDQFSPAPNQPFRIITMARLLHWKGIHLSIRAFAQADIPQGEYWILGDGPESDRLKQLSQTLGVGDRVKFWGRVPREQGLRCLSQSHVLIHASLHDSGGWVCLEAMAAGRPVICLGLGGPDFQVTPETGIKIPALNPRQTVQDLAIAIQTLAQDPEKRLQMGQRGKERVQTQFSWEAKGRELAQLYGTLVTPRRP